MIIVDGQGKETLARFRLRVGNRQSVPAAAQAVRGSLQPAPGGSARANLIIPRNGRMSSKFVPTGTNSRLHAHPVPAKTA